MLEYKSFQLKVKALFLIYIISKETGFGKVYRMNRSITRWLYKKAAEAIGEEEMASLKNDLISPVKSAAKEALADMLQSQEDDDRGKS